MNSEHKWNVCGNGMCNICIAAGFMPPITRCKCVKMNLNKKSSENSHAVFHSFSFHFSHFLRLSLHIQLETRILSVVCLHFFFDLQKLDDASINSFISEPYNEINISSSWAVQCTFV